MIKEVLILTIALCAIAHAFPAPGDLVVIPEGAALEPVGVDDDLAVAEAGYGNYGRGHGGGGHYGGGHHGGGGHYGGGHHGGGHYGGGHRGGHYG